MGLRWERGRKPHEFFEKKQDELHDDVIPEIGMRVAEALKDEIQRRTPHGVKWVPYGSPTATPVRTSNLIDSIKKDFKGKWRSNSYVWAVSTNKDYASYVEYGTNPHIIRAKPGQSLVYYTKGQQDGAREVEHPGTRPVFMFTKGVATMRPRVKNIAEPSMLKWARTD